MAIFTVEYKLLEKSKGGAIVDSGIKFGFTSFSELNFSVRVPTLIFLFEGRTDPIIAKRFPDLEYLRKRLDKAGTVEEVDSQSVVIDSFREDGKVYPLVRIYIKYPWKRSKRWDLSSINLYQLVRIRVVEAIKLVRNAGFNELRVLLPNFFYPENLKSDRQKDTLRQFVQTIVEGIIYQEARLYDFKNVKVKKISTVNFTYFGQYDKAVDGFFQKAIGDGVAIGDSLVYSRRLIDLPPNFKYPPDFLQLALETELDFNSLKTNGPNWKTVKGFYPNTRVSLIYGLDNLRDAGFNLIAGVGQGSVYEPALIKVHYIPHTERQKPIKHVVLTGKAVTFDSGGLDLKGAASYEGMHYDMAGGAIALALVKLAAKQNLPVELTALVPVVHNAIGSKAINPHTILKAFNGKTVEIVDTDCEGRLILADAVSYSESIIKPDCNVTIATLGDLRDIGPDILKVFVAPRKWENKIRKAEHMASEKAMIMPPLEYFNHADEEYEGEKSDLVNSVGNFYNYHISPALFIYNFFKYELTNWIFVDVSACMETQAKDYDAGPAFGLRLVWYFLKQLV